MDRSNPQAKGSFLGAWLPDWVHRDGLLLVRAMLRAYHRTIPNRQALFAVTTTASVVRADQVKQFWGRTVTLRAITADIRIIRGNDGSISAVTSGGFLLIAGEKGVDFYVRKSDETWSIVGSASGSLLVTWSSEDGLPVPADDFGT